MQVKKRIERFPRHLIDAVTLDGLRLGRMSVNANLKVERYVLGGRRIIPMTYRTN